MFFTCGKVLLLFCFIFKSLFQNFIVISVALISGISKPKNCSRNFLNGLLLNTGRQRPYTYQEKAERQTISITMFFYTITAFSVIWTGLFWTHTFFYVRTPQFFPISSIIPSTTSTAAATIFGQNSVKSLLSKQYCTPSIVRTSQPSKSLQR